MTLRQHTNERAVMPDMTAVPVVSLGPIPTTYVYVARLQEALHEITKALEAASDQVNDHAAAGAAVERARQCIEGIYALKADGIEQPDPLDGLVTDVLQTCASIFSMLVAEDYQPGISDEERIAVAANEVRELHRRTEARVVFSGMGPLTDGGFAPDTPMPPKRERP